MGGGAPEAECDADPRQGGQGARVVQRKIIIVMIFLIIQFIIIMSATLIRDKAAKVRVLCNVK